MTGFVRTLALALFVTAPVGWLVAADAAERSGAPAAFDFAAMAVLVGLAALMWLAASVADDVRRLRERLAPPPQVAQPGSEQPSAERSWRDMPSV